MPRFILHVGPHKTGSTYLQSRLFANREHLEAAGYHVAALWNDNPLKPSHTGLVQRLVTERRHELRPIFFAWQRSDVDAVIITCEDIASLTLAPVKLRMLRELVEGSPVSVVYYVRRWSDLLASEWQEYVKQGETYQLLEVLVHNLRDPLRSRIINIDATLRLFARLFGKANLRLVSYSALTEAGVDLFDHFIENFCAALPLPQTACGRENASLSPAKIELLRIFNQLGRETGIDSGRLLRFFFTEYAPAPLTTLVDHLSGFVKTIDVDDRDRSVQDVLRKNWAAYGSCAVAPTAAGRFYAPQQRKLSFVDPSYALSPGFALAARRLCRDLQDMTGV